MNAEADDAPPPAREPNKVSVPEKSKAVPVVEWFWGSAAMRTLQAKRRGPTPEKLFYNRQANLSVELARNVLEPLQPLEYGPAQANACELYRQGIYWGLCARSEASDGTAVTPPSFDSAWSGASRDLLVQCAGDEAALRGLEEAIKGKGFVDFAELTPSASRELATTLRNFTETLVDGLDVTQLEVERIWTQRVLRVGALLLGAAVSLGVLLLVLSAREEDRDVAVGKPWVASSRYPEGCTSPNQKCENSPNFFFHTQEEQDPSIIFDLLSSTRISGVRVSNRGDCCAERAVPLVVEVSEDKEHWTEVTRRMTEFGTWSGSFASVQARYVKFHVPRLTNLHFASVRILR